MVLSLLSGVAMFLYGMLLMGDGLKMVAGNKLEKFLYKMTNTPLKGVALGAGVTCIIQSSSATTVMVIGFVNSMMMKLRQAISIIMGANIGTSITGWILCLSYIEGSGGWATILSTATISALVAVAGIVLRMFGKRSVYRNIGNIMLGFAILMMGMQTMSGAVEPLRENEIFTSFDKAQLPSIREGMYAVMNEAGGTAYRYFSNFPIKVAGKTGTAQVISFSQAEKKNIREADLEYYTRSHTWLTSYAPYKNPKYSVTVLLEHGGRNTTTAKITAEIYKKLMELGYIQSN